jgi:uncharacterized protein YjbI with pentapeptide repeats
MNPVLSHIAAVHADFRANLVPVMDRFGNQQSAYLDERVRLRYRAQAEDVAAYLVKLSALFSEMAAAGFAPPPDLKAECAVLVIENSLVLPCPIDLPALDFRSTRFQADANFIEATFLGFANFHRADFLGEADFKNADFLQGGDFRRTVFCKSAGFFCAMCDQKVDFSGATFVGYADFEGYVSGGFKFDDVKFLGGTED